MAQRSATEDQIDLPCGQRVKKVHLCGMKAHEPHASTNASPRPLVVGLTGGMAAGKSTVARMLETLGAAVWDADSVAKDLYKTHPLLRDAIVARWGEALAIRNRQGEAMDIRRPALAQVIFQDPSELKWLESQVHPLVADAFEQWLRGLPSGTRVAVREAAILFESGSDQGCDLVVSVEADEALRIERVHRRAIQRGETPPTNEDLQGRLSRQWTSAKRMERADAVILNNDHDQLLPQVLALFDAWIGRPC